MALKVPNEGELQLLDKMLKDALTVDENYILKLYRTDVTPGDTDTSASYTEANFTDYAAKTLTRAGWYAAAANGGVAESSYATQSWTCGASGNTVFGYWVEGATSTDVLWSEKFGTARTLDDGDVLNLTLKFSLQTQS